jgi:hypothetical protein
VILGTSAERMAATYAMAAAKLLGAFEHPVQPATRQKCRRFLMLALEFLAE